MRNHRNVSWYSPTTSFQERLKAVDVEQLALSEPSSPVVSLAVCNHMSLVVRTSDVDGQLYRFVAIVRQS